MQPGRGKPGKSQGDRLAPGRYEFGFIWFAQDRAAKGIRNDQAGVAGDQILRKIMPDREVEQVAIGAVFRPFCIAFKVSNGGLYLNDNDPTVRADGGDIGASTIGECHFRQTRKPMM